MLTQRSTLEICKRGWRELHYAAREGAFLFSNQWHHLRCCKVGEQMWNLLPHVDNSLAEKTQDCLA